MAAAFVGEISAIIEFQNTEYLKSLLSDLDKKAWKPIDEPPERLFNVYEAAAPNLGLLEAKIVEKITKFYWLKNEERGKERTLGKHPQGYMEFESPDKKIFLKAYIKLNERLQRDGQEIINILRSRYDLENEQAGDGQ